MRSHIKKIVEQGLFNAVTRAVVVGSGLALIASIAVPAFATENGASTYPAGVDTVMSAMQPGKGQTSLYDYTNTYFANELAGPNGKSALPEFKLRVAANAIKVVHDWGVPFLGGTLHSNVAVPLVYEELHTPGGSSNKTGIANISIAVLGATYNRGDFHWYYEGDVFLPGGGYNKNAMVNIGQHNFAGGPAAAVTYLPYHGRTELSSKLQYLVNAKNGDNNYASGNEFTWEYDAMQRVTRHVSIGANGYFFKQTTDDQQNGVVVNGGNRGRNLAIGPELRFHVGSFGGAFKYERDTLVQNRARGNALWFQFGVPLTHAKGKQI